MTVTLIQKDKGKGKNKVAAKEKSDLDVKVDRLITLKVEIDAVKSSIAEYEKLRKELSALSDTISAANEQVLFSGELGDVTFSPKSFERTITDMPKVFELPPRRSWTKPSARIPGRQLPLS